MQLTLWILLISCQIFASVKPDVRQNLYDLQQQRLLEANFHPKKIHQQNRKVIRQIESLETKSDPDSKRVTALNNEQIREVVDYAASHPVAGFDVINKYDPDGIVGFCFGRALFVHLELLRRGVAKESIKKVFVVGEMQSGTIMWQFHVATAVKGTDGKWWVLDPAMGLMELREWYMSMKDMAVNHRISLFETPVSKIGPSAWEYNTQEGGLFDPAYRNYFKDLFASFKDTPVEKDYRKSCKTTLSK